MLSLFFHLLQRHGSIGPAKTIACWRIQDCFITAMMDGGTITASQSSIFFILLVSRCAAMFCKVRTPHVSIRFMIPYSVPTTAIGNNSSLTFLKLFTLVCSLWPSKIAGDLVRKDSALNHCATGQQGKLSGSSKYCIIPAVY